jgi:glycosyltransferase involved in cell wall biosynthesis
LSDLPRLLLCSFDVIPGPAGSSRRVTEYLKALPDRFSVVVLSVKTPDHSHIEKYEGARLLRVPVGSGDLASRIQTFERAVRRQLESEEYALAHFTDPFGGYALCEHKGDYGYRLIYEAHGFPSQELLYTHPQLEGDRKFLSKVRRQELFCLMNADLVLTGSPTTRSFIHSLGVGQESVRVIRAPVDLGPYVPEALGAPDGSPMRLMYLGSQAPWQGLAGLLRGLALAVKQEDVRLSLVGARHPDWQPHLEDLVAELGLKEHVEFQPPVSHDDVAKVLTLADVGVLPLDDVERNRLQGGSLAKVSEYLAAGRPVLAADLPVARELVPPLAGVFYPPGDAQALADRIIELARDVPRRISLGRQARAYAQQGLDAGLIRGQLLDIYDGLLGKHPVTVDVPSDEPPLEPTSVTGTPTNRILARAGTVSAGAPEPAPAAATNTEATMDEPKPTDGPARKDASREELPLVMGHVLVDEGLDNRLIKTEPAASRSEGPPVVMGLPLREASSSSTSENAPTEQVSRQSGLPVVMGLPLREEASSTSESAPTEQVSRQSGPPVVMGLPLREPPAPPVARPPPPLPPEEPRAISPAPSRARPVNPNEPPSPPPAAPARPAPIARPSTLETRPAPAPAPTPEPVPPRPPALPPRPSRAMEQPPALRPVDALPRTRTVEPPSLPDKPRPSLTHIPALPPRPARPGASLPTAPPLPTELETPAARPPQVRASVPFEEPEEISEAEAEEIQEVDGVPTPTHARPLEEPEEISSEEIQEAEVPAAPPKEPPESKLNAWFAQLAHGYCPPEGTHFARHTPPTTFPGRDGEPEAPPPPRAQAAVRSKPS